MTPIFPTRMKKKDNQRRLFFKTMKQYHQYCVCVFIYLFTCASAFIWLEVNARYDCNIGPTLLCSVSQKNKNYKM